MELSLPQRKSRYTTQGLGDAHREIIRLYALGMPIQDIAAQMNCSRHHVRYVVNSPLGMLMREDLANRRDDAVVDVATTLAKMCPKAVELMGEVMEGKFDGASLPLRIRVCESILDRAGYGRVTKSENRNLNASLTAEDILMLQERAANEAAAIGVLAE